ncbi:MAG TPA: nucleotidyltransferase family protein [Allosphingosinicella sp.]|nr:nucleotidyltransferase family protein [Allosphingosinicella sp.]
MRAERPWTAIILAGQRPGENDFAKANGVALKALIPVAGEPMLGRVARTLLASPSVGRVLLLAQQPEALVEGRLAWLAAEPRVALARGGDGISRSIMAVAGEPAAPWPVLIATADHVLLTPAMVEEFLAGVGGADAAFAVVERRTVEARYPETRRTWIRFSDGAFTGANLFALCGPAARAGLAIWAEVETDRKKALRLLLHFGPWLALRALTRTISLDRALAKAAARAGLGIRAVRLSDAEAAIDVDKQQDLELATEILRRWGESSAL